MVFLHAALKWREVFLVQWELCPPPPGPLFLATKISLKFTFRKINFEALKHPHSQTHFLRWSQKLKSIGIFKTILYFKKVEVRATSQPLPPPQIKILKICDFFPLFACQDFGYICFTFNKRCWVSACPHIICRVIPPTEHLSYSTSSGERRRRHLFTICVRFNCLILKLRFT